MSTNEETTKQVQARILQDYFGPGITDISQLDKIDYCVALDHGGGSSSAARMNLQKEADPKPRLLKISRKGELSVWSHIGYDAQPGENGPITIGKKAMNRRYQYSNYKGVPTERALKREITPDNFPDDSDEARNAGRQMEELTRDYIRKLFEDMLSHQDNAELRNADRARMLIIVGHPSSEAWKKEENRKNLIRIVKEATGVSNVLTTCESNAAILYAMENRSALKGAKRILIIDLGASTADITYLDQDRPDPVELSINLGGKHVDGNIAELMLQNSGMDEDSLDPEYNLLGEARIIKEIFWPKEEKDQKFEIGDGAFTITREDFARAVREMPIVVTDDETGEEAADSYCGHLAAFLQSAYNAHGIQAVDWVIITGGAARMKPAMEVIRSQAKHLWQTQSDHIWPDVIQDQLIDESVPVGSLLFYQKGMQIIGSIPAVQEKLCKECADMVEPMAEEITKDLVDYLMPNVILPVFRKFRDSNVDQSCQQLEKQLKNAFEEAVHQKKIRELTSGAVKRVTEKRKERFQKIIADYLNDLYGYRPGAAVWNTELQVELTDVTADVMKSVQQYLSSELLDMALEAIIIVLLPVIVVGAIVYGIWEAITDWFRTDEQKQKRKLEQERKEQVQQKAKEENVRKEYVRPQSARERKKIYKSACKEETKQKIKEQMTARIEEQLNAECEKNAFGVSEAYLSKLAESIGNAVYIKS